MFAALARAFGQLSDPRFQRVLWRSILIALLTFVLLWTICWFGLSWAGDLFGDWLARSSLWDWVKAPLEWLIGAVSLTSIVIASFFLFPAVTLIAMSFLLEDIADAVERRYYPNLPPARTQPFGETAVGILVFACVTLVANLVALPFYLLLLFVPLFIPFVFYLLNGYLLSREYFELVAVRRISLRESHVLRRAHRGRILLAGMIIAFLLTLPVLNLIMPIVATAFMMHVFERVRRNQAGAR